eukprot:scaffold118665_cov30-Tisochrysis_lutea.AAC.3
MAEENATAATAARSVWKCRTPKVVSEGQLIAQENEEESQKGELGPTDRSEKRECIRRLPEEEVGEALLPRGADEQIHRGGVIVMCAKSCL